MDNKQYIDTLVTCGYVDLEHLEYEGLINSNLELERFLKFFIKNKDIFEVLVRECLHLTQMVSKDYYSKIYERCCGMLEAYHKFKVEAHTNIKRLIDSIETSIIDFENLNTILEDIEGYRIIELDYYFTTCYLTNEGVRYRIVSEDKKDFDIYTENGTPIRYGCEAIVMKGDDLKVYYDRNKILGKRDYDLLITI